MQEELEESDPESDKQESPNKVMDNQPIYQALKEKQDPEVSKRILIKFFVLTKILLA